MTMKWVAVFLEILMFVVFLVITVLYTRFAIVGVAAWVTYFHFSATRAMIFDKWLEPKTKGDDAGE